MSPLLHPTVIALVGVTREFREDVLEQHPIKVSERCLTLEGIAIRGGEGEGNGGNGGGGGVEPEHLGKYRLRLLLLERTNDQDVFL